jgi:hypothetical protein
MAEVKQERFVRPEVLQAALLDEIAERLLRLENLLAKPKGYTYPIKIAVNKLEVLDFVEHYPYTPLFSVTLFNDGPHEVYPGINIHQMDIPLEARESVEFDLQAPKIVKLYLDVPSGKTANIRGFGIF